MKASKTANKGAVPRRLGRTAYAFSQEPGFGETRYPLALPAQAKFQNSAQNRFANVKAATRESWKTLKGRAPGTRL